MSMTSSQPFPYHRPPQTAPYLHDWLNKSRKWDIEYNGFFSNHISHIWIVLGALHSPPSRFQEKQDLFTNPAFDHAGGPLDPPRSLLSTSPTITDENWKQHILAIPTHYPAYLKYFDSLLKTPQHIPRVIKEHLPYLLPGLGGSALHTIIQTGWGADVLHPGTVSEGLAYMCSAYQPLSTPACLYSSESNKKEDKECSNLGPIAATKRYLTLAKEQNLSSIAYKASLQPRYTDLHRGAFQQRMMTFNDPTLPLGAVLNSVMPLSLPSIPHAINECIALAAAAVRGSEGEFFVIHGATSLFGVLACLEYLDEGEKREALGYWWRAAMAAITVQNLPGLKDTTELLGKWEEMGGHIIGEKSVGEDSASANGAGEEENELSAWWKERLERSIEANDEHVAKAVYIAWRWSLLEALPEATRSLCRDVGEFMGRENDVVDDNYWMFTFDNEKSYDEQGAAARENNVLKA